MFYSKELNRIIYNYDGSWKVTSFDYWPNIVSNPELRQGAGFHRAEPEEDIQKTIWSHYTLKVHYKKGWEPRESTLTTPKQAAANAASPLRSKTMAELLANELTTQGIDTKFTSEAEATYNSDFKVKKVKFEEPASMTKKPKAPVVRKRNVLIRGRGVVTVHPIGARDHAGNCSVHKNNDPDENCWGCN